MVEQHEQHHQAAQGVDAVQAGGMEMELGMAGLVVGKEG